MKTKILKTGNLVLAAVLVLGLVVLAACSSGYGSTKTVSSTTPAAGNAVVMSNYSFVPATITVAKGTTVTWTNNDSTTHTVTSDTGAFASSNIAPNGKFSYTFNTAGTFKYHCSIHPTMTGTVVVQ